MTGADLKTLVDGYVKYKAKAEASEEVIQSERKAHDEYVESVNGLIKAHTEERTAYEKQLKNLEKQMKRTAIELYGGYNSEYRWEGGIRFVWRLW